MTGALLAWQRERFPLRNGIFFVLLYATALLVGRSAAHAPASFAARDLPGLAALWAFFLMLRVFDEHKDFAADAIAHPHRVLQRGLVTLPQLARLGLAAVVVQLGVSLWLDGGLGPVTRAWLATLAWSLLMTREFFAPAWLRRRIMLYALSHMLVMPLVALWVATMGAPGAIKSPAVWALAGFTFLATLAFEVARKIRAPEDEHPMADSYTQSLGVPAAAALLLALVAGAAGAALGLTWMVTGALPLAQAAPLAFVVAAAAVAIARFGARPTRAAVKLSETAAGIATLGAHLVIIASLLAASGR